MTFQDVGADYTATLPSGKQVPGIVVRQRGTDGADPYADFPTAPKGATPKSAAAPGDPYADFPTEAPKAQPPARQVGAGEALAAGAVHGVTFGAVPAIAGATAAGDAQTPKDLQSAQDQADAMEPSASIGRMLTGAYMAWQGDPVAKDAYDRGREAALADEKLAKEQHPVAFLSGQLAGAMAMPLPGAGAMRAGTIGVRALGGAKAGAAGGGMYGAGEALGEGQSAGDVAKSAGLGAVIGAPLGAAIGSVVGPRARAALTPGEQAARTAEIIGAPIPKGVASDSRAVQSLTSAAGSMPFSGAKIGSSLAKNAEAAGNVVGGSGIDQAIAANKAHIDSLYNGVRGAIDPDRVMPMPRTAATVEKVKARRAAARQPNPSQGLEQFDSVGSQGASFNGAHRARVDARDAGSAVNPHPGYNAADYNAITRAMTADIRAGVHAQGGPRALGAFDRAEESFGPISEANKFLARIARARGPDETLEYLGRNPATGEFSLDQFVTAWNKLNPQIKPFVPEPQHRAAIEAVFQMGKQIKGAMRGKNTSHTSTPIIMYDLAHDAIVGGVAAARGLIKPSEMIGAAVTAVPGLLFMHWLAKPSIASSMGAWARAYRVATLGAPTPARLAAFNLATRNLASNLGVPVEDILRAAQRRLAAPADNENQDQQ